MDIQQIKDIKLNFILATARTGSTLLSSMFNTHPNVISTIEEPFAYNLYPKYRGIKKWTSEIIQQYCYDFYLFSEGRLEVQFGTKKELETLLERNKENLNIELAIKFTYLCFFPNKDKSNITTVVDKELIFHQFLTEVAIFYPDSKFIILHRDPRDNAFTQMRMYKNKKEYKEQDYLKISDKWNYTYGTLLDFKDKIGSHRFIDVKYEDLVTNPEVELKKLCSFLSIKFDSEMLNYDEQVKKELIFNKEKFGNESKKQLVDLHEGLVQKPSTSKIGYWKNSLTEKEANLVWTVCGNLAEKIGYIKDEQFIEQRLTIKQRLAYTKILLDIIKTKIYYSLPFFIKHLFKKIKYGKTFKTNKWESQDFYRKSYYGK